MESVSSLATGSPVEIGSESTVVGPVPAVGSSPPDDEPQPAAISTASAGSDGEDRGSAEVHDGSTLVALPGVPGWTSDRYWMRIGEASIGKGVCRAEAQDRNEKFLRRHLFAGELGRVVVMVGIDELACQIAEVKDVLDPKPGRVRVEMAKDHSGVFGAPRRCQARARLIRGPARSSASGESRTRSRVRRGSGRGRRDRGARWRPLRGNAERCPGCARRPSRGRWRRIVRRR